MAKAKADSSGMKKTQMVEAAMDALGGDPSPKAIQDYVKQQHGTDLSYAMASSYKSNINKKRAGGGGGRGRGGAAPSGSVDLKDVAAVKALVDRLGAARLNDIIKLVGK